MLTCNEIDALTDSHDGSIYSDLYKDVYGFRPRGVTFESVEKFQRSWDYLVEQLEANQAAERVAQAENVKAFEARIVETISLGAGDRETAIRWILDAEETDDREHLEWKLNIPYGYLSKGQ